VYRENLPVKVLGIPECRRAVVGDAADRVNVLTSQIGIRANIPSGIGARHGQPWYSHERNLARKTKGLLGDDQQALSLSIGIVACYFANRRHTMAVNLRLLSESLKVPKFRRPPKPGTMQVLSRATEPEWVRIANTLLTEQPETRRSRREVITVSD
jgi:hypothetical protein